MRTNYDCLSCLINQVVKVAELTNVSDKEANTQKGFSICVKDSNYVIMNLL